MKWAGHFRHAKSGVLGCGSFRATGPWVCGKLELVRFRFCACRFRTNVPRLFSAVGAHSVRPRAGLGPAPTQRQTRFPILRRGGCPHPPAAGSDPPVGAAPCGRPRAGLGPATTQRQTRSRYSAGAGGLTRPPQRVLPLRRGGYQPPETARWGHRALQKSKYVFGYAAGTAPCGRPSGGCHVGRGCAPPPSRRLPSRPALGAVRPRPVGVLRARKLVKNF